MKFARLLTSTCLLFGAFSFLASAAVAAPGDGPIQIVSAYYGSPKEARPHDFSERLQQICGPDASACETFCSHAAIGGPKGSFRLPFSTAPLCRVIYRCGTRVTKATEASENDTLILMCRPNPN